MASNGWDQLEAVNVLNNPNSGVTSTGSWSGFAGSSVGGSPANGRLAKFQIIDLNDGTVFSFHALPDSFETSKGVNWSRTGIHGRSSPLYGYNNSEPITINLRIPIHSSIEANDRRTVLDVKEACDYFQALAYPDYRNGQVTPPHRVRFKCGGQFSLDCVVESSSVNYTGPWDVNTGLSHGAIVNLSLAEVSDIPKDHYEARGGLR